MTFAEPVAIDVERIEGGVALAFTADRSRKRFVGTEVERIRLTHEQARILHDKIGEALA
jgi:hypothetical protein